MTNDVIKVHGEDTVVREDTGKAYRGVHWAYLSIGGFIIIAVIIAMVLLFGASRDGSIETPAQSANANSSAR